VPWRGPSYEGEVPTLGYDVLDWIHEYLIVPDGPSAGEPLVLTAEQAQFVLNFYRVDPKFRGGAVVGRSLVNARLINRAILSRPKGWGKSPDRRRDLLRRSARRRHPRRLGRRR
jgi:hypothetical protein